MPTAIRTLGLICLGMLIASPLALADDLTIHGVTNDTTIVFASSGGASGGSFPIPTNDGDVTINFTSGPNLTSVCTEPSFNPLQPLCTGFNFTCGAGGSITLAFAGGALFSGTFLDGSGAALGVPPTECCNSFTGN